MAEMIRIFVGISICETMRLFFFARVFVDAISSNNRAQDEISMVQT